MICKRKCSCFFVLAVSAMSLCGCGDRKGQVEGENAGDSVAVCRIDTVPEQNGPDQTLYGKGTEFGMSTFVLETNDSTEYDVTRVSEAGQEGRIFGTVAPGQRYAMMMEKSDEALTVLINLDELDRFVKDQYYIYNGELVLTLDGNREWVDIESLSKTEFKAKGKTGKMYEFKL